jgi:hypothetical protein
MPAFERDSFDAADGQPAFPTFFRLLLALKKGGGLPQNPQELRARRYRSLVMMALHESA